MLVQQTVPRPGRGGFTIRLGTPAARRPHRTGTPGRELDVTAPTESAALTTPGPAPSGPQATTESESESESGGPGAATSAVRVGLRRRTGRARLSRRSRRPAAGAQLS